MTNTERMTNDEARNGDALAFVIRASSFFRHSSFWFRHFLSARNRRDDGDFVAVLNLRRLAVEESDVFIVEEDVHETADLAGLVADALLEAGKAPVEIVEDFSDRR